MGPPNRKIQEHSWERAWRMGRGVWEENSEVVGSSPALAAGCCVTLDRSLPLSSSCVPICIIGGLSPLCRQEPGELQSMGLQKFSD